MSKRRVLIVEPKASLRESLVNSLDGWERVGAGDVTTGLEYLTLFRPELVILGGNIPTHEGISMVETLVDAGVPVLALEGFTHNLPRRVRIGLTDILPDAADGELIKRKAEEALSQQPSPSSPFQPEPFTGSGRILLVDDDPPVRNGMAEYLRLCGFEVQTAGTPAAAADLLRQVHYDLLVTDWVLPGHSGMTVLLEAKRVTPRTPVVVLTGYGTPELVRRALDAGAVEVLVKPLPPETLPALLQRYLNPACSPGAGTITSDATPATDRPARSERSAIKSGRPVPQAIVGSSHAIRLVMGKLAVVGPTTSTVLLLGETGTGKEVFARSLHTLSPRADGPFVAVNVAAIPEALVESELFGYAPGAFTGAKREGHTGKLVAADRGTFFLDEIGDLPLPLQAKLLRVLEEQEVTPMNGSSRRIDVRFVAATHRNLRAMVEEGKFRQDLFYRLNVFSLTLPPLRERREDIPALVSHFLARIRESRGGPVREVSPEAMECLRALDWPGNVRELRNAVEYAYTVATGTVIKPEHLPQESAWFPEPVGQRDVNTEREAILQALERARWNKTKAAHLLGISRTALYGKLHIYNLL